MTVCDLCKGTGKLLKPWYDTTGAMTGMTGDICFMCDGKGTIGEPMTNEEWFCSLSTEEKAKWLSKIKQPFPCSTFLKCDKSCGLSTQCRGDDVEPTDKERWVEWLKQPHSEVEK